MTEFARERKEREWHGAENFLGGRCPTTGPSPGPCGPRPGGRWPTRGGRPSTTRDVPVCATKGGVDRTITYRGRFIRRRRSLLLRVAGGQEVRLSRGRVTLGRGQANSVSLNDLSVSSTHAEIRDRGEWVELRDLNSRNGTKVNGRRVFQVALEAGDRIHLGEVELEVVELAEMDVPISQSDHLGELWGWCDAMREVFVQLDEYAASPVNLLISGETGSGKELAARTIHEHSPRRAGPFRKVDFASLDPARAQVELFGYTADAAPPGAVTREAPGAFELAEGGTLLLDEVGDLAPALQALLLRVVDRREFSRAGEHATRRANVRVIAATNCDLRMRIADKEFREDLFFRLVQGEIELPPLRQRYDDACHLAQLFVRRLAAQLSEPNLRICEEALERIGRFGWPGNVRQLENEILHAAHRVLHRGETTIGAAHLRLSEGAKRGALGWEREFVRLGSLDAMYQELHERVLPFVLAQNGCSIKRTAEVLGVGRVRLRELMRKAGLSGTD